MRLPAWITQQNGRWDRTGRSRVRHLLRMSLSKNRAYLARLRLIYGRWGRPSTGSDIRARVAMPGGMLSRSPLTFRRAAGFIDPCLLDACPRGGGRSAVDARDQARWVQVHLPAGRRPGAGVHRRGHDCPIGCRETACPGPLLVKTAIGLGWVKAWRPGRSQAGASAASTVCLARGRDGEENPAGGLPMKMQLTVP